MHPTSAEVAIDTRHDLRTCMRLLGGGSRTFRLASHVLPRRVREDACALYAFCRIADDIVDGGADGAGIAALQGRLARLLAGQPDDCAADRALSAVVRRCQLPHAALEALIEGFVWDGAARQYADLAQLERYCLRVAGSVGVLMAAIMGVTQPDALVCACELGMAMQLSNIARDVGEDARMGRLYLPHDWMHAAGLAPAAWLEAPSFDARVATVIARVLARADALYRHAALGIADLPAPCRPAIRLASRLYCAIGEEVARNRFDSISQRAVVSRRRKLALAASAAWRTPFAGAAPDWRAPEAALAFIAQLQASGFARSAHAPTAPLLVRVYHLFERMERRDRALRQSARDAARLSWPQRASS